MDFLGCLPLKVVDHACKNSSRVSVWVIQPFVDEDEVQQQDKIVVN